MIRVNLFAECPFWVVTQLCGLDTCGVCECDENEIPLPWRIEDSTTDRVEITPTPPGFTKWDDSRENMWVVSPGSDSDMSYVNLEVTPEAHTGYDGSSVWEAIYNENCFTRPLDQMCLEERVFYRLISGLHSSITTHIALFYRKDKTTGEWEHNPSLFRQRFQNQPDRIENIAVSKIGGFLTEYQFNTGDQVADSKSYELVQELLKSKLMCQPNFDESLLFKDTYDKENLIGQFKEHFQNISSILNCVTCEKCKLYGKLQTLGLGTALKILFDDNVSSLQRNEIIALINTLRQLSTSIANIEKLSQPLNQLQFIWNEIIRNLNFKSIKQMVTSFIKNIENTINNSNRNNKQVDDASPFSLEPEGPSKRIKFILAIITTSISIIVLTLVYIFCIKSSSSTATSTKNSKNNQQQQQKQNNNINQNHRNSPKKNVTFSDNIKSIPNLGDEEPIVNINSNNSPTIKKVHLMNGKTTNKKKEK
eukprot:gene2796-3477_t